VALPVLPLGSGTDEEAHPERKERLCAVGSFMGDTGKDFAAEVVAKVIAHQVGVG
jgi:hypothetical protein